MIYGVWLRWGLLYIGQTSEAERRLRDLAVGESHHLANTFPPEIWHKVVVLTWPELPEAQSLVGTLDSKTVGLALEFALQEQLSPVVNSERRRPDGGWRDVVRQGSTSRGALAAPKVVDLVQAVRRLWDATPSRPTEEAEALQACRVVFPEQLLLQPQPPVP
ncbi:hypothetical protein AB0283_02960 [Micromonospora vinacea]|uniref:hypothetical protein n=1 Tax=Micromonospora vinacea TaxID=709878 RepID=UPI00344E792E